MLKEDLRQDVEARVAFLKKALAQAEADVAYYRALVEYQLAVKNLQLEKGTLLEYCQIFLSEGAWPSQAYDDAEFRESMRGDTHTQIPVGGDETPWVSRGAVR